MRYVRTEADRAAARQFRGPCPLVGRTKGFAYSPRTYGRRWLHLLDMVAIVCASLVCSGVVYALIMVSIR